MAIKGAKVCDRSIKEAAKVAAKEVKPRSSVIASEWYRRELVEVLVDRAFHQAWEKIQAKAGRR